MSENRVITVGTKLSGDEYVALMAVCGQEDRTRSNYVAEAVVDKLRRDGWLTAIHPCHHRRVAHFDWGDRCEDCNTVLRGKYVGSVRP